MFSVLSTCARRHLTRTAAPAARGDTAARAALPGGRDAGCDAGAAPGAQRPAAAGGAAEDPAAAARVHGRAGAHAAAAHGLRGRAADLAACTPGPPVPTWGSRAAATAAAAGSAARVMTAAAPRLLDCPAPLCGMHTGPARGAPPAEAAAYGAHAGGVAVEGSARRPQDALRALARDARWRTAKTEHSCCARGTHCTQWRPMDAESHASVITRGHKVRPATCGWKGLEGYKQSCDRWHGEVSLAASGWCIAMRCVATDKGAHAARLPHTLIHIDSCHSIKLVVRG